MDLFGVVRNLGKDPDQTLGPLASLPLVARVAQWLAGIGRPDAVFIHIPKTAGSSVFDVLHGFGALKYRYGSEVSRSFPQRGMVSFAHMDYAGLVQGGLVSPRFDRAAFKFTFVRNPYDRAVSLYLYLRRLDLVPEETSFVEFLRELERDGCPRIGPYNYLGLSQCNPQVRWTEQVDMDFVGRFESLEEDFAELLTRLGLDPRPLPHRNPTTRRDDRTYLTEEARELVVRCYAEDFDAFGYER